MLKEPLQSLVLLEVKWTPFISLLPITILYFLAVLLWTRNGILSKGFLSSVENGFRRASNVPIAPWLTNSLWVRTINFISTIIDIFCNFFLWKTFLLYFRCVPKYQHPPSTRTHWCFDLCWGFSYECQQCQRRAWIASATPLSCSAYQGML